MCTEVGINLQTQNQASIQGFFFLHAYTSSNMRRDKSDCDIEGVSACVSCDVTHECELVTERGGERRWVTKGRDKEKTAWKHSTWKQRIVTRLPPQGPEITPIFPSCDLKDTPCPSGSIGDKHKHTMMLFPKLTHAAHRPPTVWQPHAVSQRLQS